MAPSQKEQDVQMLLAADVHLGTKNCDYQMERYVYKRQQNSGIHIINLAKTWEKMHMAARVIVGIENPQDIVVQSARPYGQRAVLKFAQYTGAQAIAGRHTPGTFTNQIQNTFMEPRLLILTDPRTDHQPIRESSFGNIPTIAFCNTDSPLVHVDIAIPANNKGKHAIGVLYWMLSRMVLQMRGTIPYNQPWDIMVDLFFYRDDAVKEVEEEGAAPEFGAPAVEYGAPALPQAPGVADAQWDATPAVATEWDPSGAPAAAAPVATEWAPAPAPAASGWETPAVGGGWDTPAVAAAAPAPVAGEWDPAPAPAPAPAAGGWDAPTS